jgi:hypothetical protein
VTRRKAQDATVECAWRECKVRFEPKRSTAKYHSTTCRSRAARDRAAAAAAAKADEAAAAGDAEHSLVTTVRDDLEKAGVLNTVDGQIALQLARRAVQANAAGVSALMRELRATIAAAKEANPAPTPVEEQPPPEPPTKLDEARRRREQKAREAADRA